MQFNTKENLNYLVNVHESRRQFRLLIKKIPLIIDIETLLRTFPTAVSETMSFL